MSRKYIILVGDGMADHPLKELEGKTPLQAAYTPHMDFIAKNGLTGYVKTVPAGFPPGSDVANLSLLGYDPQKYYTGRAPLESADLNVTPSPEDIAFRCNFVTLSGKKDDLTMEDFSAGHISTEEASELIEFMNKELGDEGLSFYTGVSYRHLMVWKNGTDKTNCTPPHDISTQTINSYLPSGEGSEFVNALIRKSQKILVDHPVNKKRVKNGLKPANSIWLWGQGKAVSLLGFKEKYGIRGAVISAVNLVRGIGRLADLEVVKVPGITGYLDTNYQGKVDYAIGQLKESDFIYVHVEAPDEAGHTGNLKDKIRAIEDFDAKIVGEVLEKIKQFNDYRVMILCDHPTPVKLMTHTSDPVPYALYPYSSPDNILKYEESIVQKGSRHFEKGHELIDFFIS